MPYDPPPDLAGLSLSRIAELVAERRLAPVDTWRPDVVGSSDMRIAADGRWYHEGTEIRRAAMVRAFSQLLIRDAQGQHWLVTPGQKLSIVVDDAAFLAVDLKHEGDALVFRLNTDEFVIADSDHPLIARGSIEAPAIYLAVRHGIEARLDRSTWLQLAEIAIELSDMSVSSKGCTFALAPSV
ncbi:DUF1285 domain-containing protein [Novosphingobium sp. 9]|uniref:DUF1285 domain-containing protein n=1 Tax=Novosphingobium sp. 9 TaxID=2025349 RepID=UPI0021B60026|nr:DUF1285 domain-containing protein [Novosphingobium sp. 9]